MSAHNSNAYPLLRSQREIWLGEQTNFGDASPYVVSEHVDLRGSLNDQLLCRAIQRAVEEADVLNTVLTPSDGPFPLQRVVPTSAEAVRYIDLRHDRSSLETAGDYAQNSLEELVRNSSGLPFRYDLIRLTNEHARWYQTYHHRAIDAYASNIITRRVAEIYGELIDGRAGRESPFSSLFSSIEEEADYLHSQSWLDDRKYWHNYSSDIKQSGSIYPPASGQRPEYTRVSTQISDRRFASLRSRARRLGVPWSVAVTAIVASQTAAEYGLRRVVLPFPFHARVSSQARQTPVSYANILPLPVDLDHASLADTVRELGERLAQAAEHQRYRGEDLQRDLSVSSFLDFGPLVNIMSFPYDLRFGDHPASMSNRTSGIVGRLVYAFWDRQDGRGLQLEVNGDPRLFERAGLLYRLRAMDDAIRRFCDDLSAPDERSGLAEPKAQEIPKPAPQLATPGQGKILALSGRLGKTIVDRFATVAKRRAEETALLMAGTALTYRELNERSDRLARLLIRRGAGPGKVVAIVLPRSTDLVVAILAVLKAGSAYVPMDPSYPHKRQEWIIQDSCPSLILTRSDITPLSQGRVPSIHVDWSGTSEQLLASSEYSPTDPLPRPAPGSLAYIIYTSGTTGEPKGVMATHENVVRLIDSTHEKLALHADDVWTLFHSAAFDFSVWEIFAPLLLGAAIAVIPQDIARSPKDFANVVIDNNVTVLNMTPSAFYEFTSALNDLVTFTSKASLRVVIFGGEALNPKRIDPWRRIPSQQRPRFINMYGITETTVHVTHADVSSMKGSTSSIGTPLDDLRVYLLDSALLPVRSGEVGEMYVAGPGLTRGYLGQPGLTATRFLPDPHTNRGTRMYRSGDLARLDRNGVLEYLGRADDQVKVRGYRIEPGEIENALLDYPHISESAVVAWDDDDQYRRIAAYYVAPEHQVDPAKLRDHLGRRVPSYMVPSWLFQIEAIPLNFNGKLDKSKLPQPASDALSSAGVHARRVSPVKELFSSVLKNPSLEDDSDFFQQGGDSLLAARLTSRIRKVFGVEISIADVFSSPTPAQMASRLSVSDSPQRHISRLEHAADTPASVTQRRIWLLHHIDGGGAAYNMPWEIRIDGTLDVDALRLSLFDVINRHEALRTVIIQSGEEIMQRVLPTPAPQLVVTDATPETVHEQLMQHWTRVFDLEHEIPISFVLFRLGETSYVLSLVVHHVAIDGASSPVLARDLAVAYESRRVGKAPLFDPLPFSYRDYANWQHEILSSMNQEDSVWRRDLDWWGGRLHNLPAEIALPTDYPRSVRGSTAGDYIDFEIDEALVARMTRLAHAHGASLFMVLQAGVSTLLHHVGANDDIALGFPVSGREDEQLDDIVGPFVNTVVLRADLTNRPSFTEVLSRVRDSALGAYAHQEVPFEAVVEAAAPPRGLLSHPLFQVMVSFQNTSYDGIFRLPGLAVQGRLGRTETAKFDLFFGFSWADSEGSISRHLRCVLEYSSDLFAAGTADELRHRLIKILYGAMEDPDRPIVELDVLVQEEHNWLMARGSGLPLRSSSSTSVAEAFTATLHANASRTAIVTEDSSMTYADLSRHSDNFAMRLREREVRQGDFVGIMADRSPLIVALQLAVLKLGAAYVPLDPRNGSERLRHIIEQTDCKVVVVSGRTDADADFLRPDCTLLIDERDASRAAQSTEETVATGETLPYPPGTAPAYVMYTSGSTGTPKGVVVANEDIVALSNDSLVARSCSGGVLFHSPTAFDASTFEVWGTLLNGGVVHLAPAGDLAVHDYAKLFSSGQLRTAWTTASIFDLLSVHDPTCFERLEYVWAGGEELNPGAVARVLEAAPRLRVVNGYGPTETTTFATRHLVVQRDLVEPAPGIPIGRPLDGMNIYVLNDALQPSPPGVVGEAYIGGVGVAQGYIREPGLTAARFIPDPFRGAGLRMYRTGDLAVIDRNGAIGFRGRVDRQLKFHGFRIEPSEIERVLNRHTTVQTSAVVLRRDGDGEPKLAAYVISKEPAEFDETQLRGYVGEILPAYMAPNYFIRLDELPLTTNGKLAEDRLPLPKSAGIGPQEITTRSKRFARLMARSLGREWVGEDEDYFTLGGDSITAIRFVALARESGEQLNIKDIFDYRTARSLCDHVSVIESSESAIDGLVDDGLIPATPMMGWLREKAVEVEDFAQSALLRAPRDVDEDALRDALIRILRRHDILRSRLEMREDRWELSVDERVPEEAAFHVVEEEVALESSGYESRLLKYIRAAARALSPQQGRMIEFVLLNARSSTSPPALLVVAHHLAVDGVSWRILTEDLSTAYDASLSGQQAPVEAHAAPFAHWAKSLRTSRSLEKRRKELPYWVGVLEKTVPLPADFSVDPELDPLIENISMRVQVPSEQTTTLVEDLPRIFRCGVDHVLLAALVAAVDGWRTAHDLGAGGDPVSIEVEGHGRVLSTNQVDVSRTLGWFTSVYPVVCHVPWSTSVRGRERRRDLVALLEETRDTLNAVPDGGVGYGILRYLMPDGRKALLNLAAPEFGFNYLGRLGRVGPSGEEAAGAWSIDTGNGMILTHTPDFASQHVAELQVVLADTSAGPTLQATWSGPSRIWDVDSMRELSDFWLSSLQELASLDSARRDQQSSSDGFPLAGLSKSDMSDLSRRLKR